MQNQIPSVSENVQNIQKYSADLDQALAVAGFGFYNIKYCLVLGLFLTAALVEPVGYSYVLPSAQCDLQMSATLRGFLASMPYIGVVITSFPWGYLVDTRGRKSIIIISSMLSGLFGILAAFMPDLISFTVIKFISSLGIACPGATPFTYVGEIVPKKHRDLMLALANAVQISGVAIVPLLAWAILPLDFRIDFGAYYFRSWRLLALLYPCIFIIGAVIVSFGPESPKYLLSKGRHEEALEVLKTMYAKNNKKSPEEYPVKMLIMENDLKNEEISFLKSIGKQIMPLLKCTYFKWLALIGFILFGVFSIANGLYAWVPDVLNRVLTDENGGLKTCDIIRIRLNQTASESAVCDDTIDVITFQINSVSSIVYAVICVFISSSVKFIGKKTLIVAVLWMIATFCVLGNVLIQPYVIAILLSAISTIGLVIGPLNAYAVELFPTYLRGMAVSLIMMVGRSGSIFGANVAGALLNAACDVTFYVFGGILYICGLAAFLLPRSQPDIKKNKRLQTRL